MQNVSRRGKPWKIKINLEKKIEKRKDGVFSKLQQVLNCLVKCLSASRNSVKFRLSQNVSPQNHENSVKNSSTNANARITLSNKTNSIRVQVMLNSFRFIIEERPNVQCPTYRATKETCAQGKLFARREQNLS